MFIGSLQELTLTDFPDKVACIVFLVNCNFKCKFCYNKDLTAYKFFKKSKRKLLSEQDFFKFLDSKKKMLDGVVITGGEPTVSPGLYDFVKKIKSKGFAVKLDTNGTRPEILKKFLDENIVDYVAMDIKAPDKEKYSEITQVNVAFEKIKESINLLSTNSIPHEFRTTLYPKLTDTDLRKISLLIPKQKWFLQQFEPTNAYDSKSRKLKRMNEVRVKNLVKEFSSSVDVVLRGD